MLYLIVPVYNRLESTKQFIMSLREQQYREVQLIIINDGSTDQTKEYLSVKHPEIKVLDSDGNLYWGGAINLGLDYLRNIAKRDDYIGFANNDIIFMENSINEIMQNAIGSKKLSLFHALVTDNTGICFTSGSKLLSWPIFLTRHPFRGSKYEDCTNKPMERVDFANGRFLVFKKEVLEYVSGIDTLNFIHYLGDCDFSMRLKRFKIFTYIIPSSQVTIDNSTTGLNAGRITSIREFLQSLYSIRSSNNLKLRFRFGNIHCPKCYLPFYYFAVTLQVVISSLIIRKNNN